MKTTRYRLYFFLAISCLAGYSWIFLNFFISSSHLKAKLNVCLFKRVTTIPCPSCGTTRSVLSLINFDFPTAFYLNPLGIIILPALLILPFWLAFDILTQRQSLFSFYGKFETAVKKKRLAIPAILIVLIIWISNIYKGL